MNEWDKFKSDKLTLVGEKHLFELMERCKKMEAVVEAAKQCVKFNYDETAPHPKFFLEKALKELEKK